MNYNFRSGVREDYKRTLIVSAVGLFIIGVLLGVGIGNRYFSAQPSADTVSISENRNTARDNPQDSQELAVASATEDTTAMDVEANTGEQTPTSSSRTSLSAQKPAATSRQKAASSPVASAPMTAENNSSPAPQQPAPAPLPVGGRGGGDASGGSGSNSGSQADSCTCQDPGVVGGLLNTVTDTTTGALNTLTAPLRP